ncbi:MAG: FprA family A-type flavoprotein [Syntrophorhabdaceae bacterium]|nr:FprA family A-type flavoprotein [Syntrophorhabdaceae bacterium]
MGPIEIKPYIYWVGAVDWGVRDFHGYITERGTTYNNYLIMDDQITLVDTVKHDFSTVTIENIKKLTDPKKIKNLVINHIEPDHASSIDAIMDIIPHAKIYITERGRKGVERYWSGSGWDFKVVKTGETLNTGKYTLTFLETPMLHWPDSMVTYIKEVGLLISQDAFGQHIATASRFDDEFLATNPWYELEDAIIDYYANILMPFGQLIKGKIEEIIKLGLKIEMIAPDHGLIWRKDPNRIIKMYLDMATGFADMKVAIIYDTMWQSTEKMVMPIMGGIKEEGVDCKVVKLRSSPMSVAIKEFWKARGCLVGVPTLNNLMFPSVAEFIYHLGGLRPKNRIVGAFGSYGWGGGGVKEAYEYFKRFGMDVFEPGVQVQFSPSLEDEKSCYQFGREFAKKVKEYHSKFNSL